jgi:hypothetical protein
VTIQVDSKVFDAEKGNEAVHREMVNTVGRPGKAGEHVRSIVSVNMLAEGWDVKIHVRPIGSIGAPTSNSPRLPARGRSLRGHRNGPVAQDHRSGQRSPQITRLALPA